MNVTDVSIDTTTTTKGEAVTSVVKQEEVHSQNEKTGEEKLNESATPTDRDKIVVANSNEAFVGGNVVKNPIGKSVENDRPDIIYEGDKCISVDPVTKSRYVWNEARAEWIPDNPSSSQPDLSASNNYQFDGTTYTYTDTVTNICYKWDLEKNAWVSVKDIPASNKDANDKLNENRKPTPGVNDSAAPGGVYGYENDTHTYTDPSDNTVYIWDRQKNAWFPKIDDDFMAHYQMNYGFVDHKDDNVDDKTDITKEEIKDIKAEKRKGQPQPATWFELDEENNTKVYVSNLPLDISQQEFVDLMQKCGLVMKDPDTNKMKAKLYVDAESKLLKGDGLCTYIRKESVDLALNLLDGSDYRGRKIRVERAKFTMKGDMYDPSLKPKKKKRKDKEKIKTMQEKLFDWRPDKLRGERSRNESIVIIKNLFEPSTFDKDVKLILEFQQDLREECIKCGAVKKVIIYDRNVEGVAQVNFKEPEAADACIQLLNGRWFNKRKISAETWDGKTKYRVVETDAQTKERIEKWDKYLQATEGDNVVKKKEESEEKSKPDKSKEETDISEETIEEVESEHDTKSSVDSDYTTDDEM